MSHVNLSRRRVTSCPAAMMMFGSVWTDTGLHVPTSWFWSKIFSTEKMCWGSSHLRTETWSWIPGPVLSQLNVKAQEPIRSHVGVCVIEFFKIKWGHQQLHLQHSRIEGNQSERRTWSQFGPDRREFVNFPLNSSLTWTIPDLYFERTLVSQYYS